MAQDVCRIRSSRCSGNLPAVYRSTLSNFHSFLSIFQERTLTQKNQQNSPVRAPVLSLLHFESSFGASLPVGHVATTAIHLEVLDFRSSLVQIACVPGFRNRLRRGLRLLGEIHSICSTALLPEVLDLLKYANRLTMTSD